MRQNSISQWLARQRGQWQEWLGWLILLCYVGILYQIASVHWQVLKVFLFIGVFVALPFLVIIVFKLLGSEEK